MDKIVIIGSPGAGKSTLARRLGRKLQIPVVHLDRIFWEPGWKEKSRNKRIEILKDRVKKRQWIIEGIYLGASEPRLNASDTIIFLDIPFYVCLKRIIVQHYLRRGEYRYDLIDGCKDRLTPKRILKVLAFPIRGRWMLNKKLKSYETKRIVRLHSTKEIQQFLTLVDLQAHEEKSLSRA